LSLAAAPKRGSPQKSDGFSNEANALQMLHKPLGHDVGHDLVGVADALAAPIRST
jgi:hypothetical protein